MADIYAEGQRHMDAGEWQQALRCFEQVQQLRPGYRETEELLGRARQELTPPQKVEVPDLSGKEVPQARSTLTSEGLKLGTLVKAPSDTVPEGRIIAQSPEAGTELRAGKSVDVTVSLGPSSVEVPDLTGKSRPEVRSALRAAGLTLGMLTTAPREDVPEGRVVDQHPAAGSKVERGTYVRIILSSGPQEKTAAASSGRSGAETVKVPTFPTGRSVIRDQDRRKLRLGIPLWAAAVAVVALVVLIGGGLYFAYFRDDSAKTLADEDSLGVESVAFSPDGNLLASGSSDETIKLWETAEVQR